MKNPIVNFLFVITFSIAIIMGIQFGFHLMKLPDTLLFYVGLTIVMVIAFIIGWFVIKELNKIFSDDKEKSEKNEGNKE